MHSNRFWKTQYSTEPWFSANVLWPRLSTNVGFVGHEHRNRRLFDKWYRIPNKAHRLYWRLHKPEAHQAKVKC